MDELRRLSYQLDNNNIHIIPRYIRSAENTLATKLIRQLDSDDWQLDPSVFHEMDTEFGPPTIDRFASALNTLLPSLQSKLARPVARGGGLPLPRRHPMAREKTSGATPLGHYYPTSPKSYSIAAQQPQLSPPVGKKKRGTKQLQSSSASRRSCRPALTCSFPGGGTDAIQSASLTGPSPSSGFPSGLVVPPPGSNECYYDHVQHSPDQAGNPKLPRPCN
jgi:hypothetical protein